MYDLSVALIGMSGGPEGQLWSRATLTSAWQRVPDSSLAGGDYRSIAVAKDGKIFCLDKNGCLFTRETLTTAWQPQPSSGLPGGDKGSIAVMDDESILGVGMNLNLYTYSKSSNTWVVVPDSSLAPVGAADGGSSITIMPDGKILGLAVKNGSVQLHIREELNARWTEVPKSSLPTIRSAWERFRITVLQDGTILCLACHNNYLWRRSTLLNSEWEEVVNGSSTQAFMGVVGIASGEKVAIAQLTSEGSTFSTGLDLQIKLSKELEKLKRLEAKETLLNQLIDRVLKNQGTSQSTDIRELEEYIGKSQEREETFKKGSEIYTIWQDTKISVAAAEVSASEAKRYSQEASKLYSSTPEADSASDAAEQARVYAYQAKESLIKIENSVVKQGFTIEDLTNRFTILLEENKTAQSPASEKGDTENSTSKSSNDDVGKPALPAPELGGKKTENVDSPPKTIIEKLEEIKKIAQEARGQAEKHRNSVEAEKRKVETYLEDAKKVYKNWDSVRTLFGLNGSQSGQVPAPTASPSSPALETSVETSQSGPVPAPTASSSSPALKTPVETSNWTAVKGLFSIEDSSSTNSSSPK